MPSVESTMAQPCRRRDLRSHGTCGCRLHTRARNMQLRLCMLVGGVTLTTARLPGTWLQATVCSGVYSNPRCLWSTLEYHSTTSVLSQPFPGPQSGPDPSVLQHSWPLLVACSAAQNWAFVAPLWYCGDLAGGGAAGGVPRGCACMISAQRKKDRHPVW